MARKSSSQLSLAKIGVTIVIVAVLGAIVILATTGDGKKGNKGENTLPVDEYMRMGSSLRNNEYTLYGKVENRENITNGALVTLLIKNDRGSEDRIPVIIPQGAKSVNIEREQNYRFRVTVENRGASKGLLIAQEITQ